MLIRHYQGEPNVYVIRYRGGRITRHGQGLEFWYLPYNTSIAAVPVLTQDAPFIFNESTASFQEVAIQGQLTYHLVKPLEAAQRIDFSIDPKSGRYRAKDPEKLTQRVINAVQAHTRKGVNELALEDTLTRVKELAGEVLERVRAEPDLQALGVVVESLHFAAVTPTPELQKALEAEYRERLQRNADRAIYERRTAAVEEERKIRQSELETDIGLEERRRDLVGMQAENNLQLAEAEARADEMKLAPYGNLAPQALVGLALKEFAGNAGKIGSLSITPDLLSELVAWTGGRDHERTLKRSS